MIDDDDDDDDDNDDDGVWSCIIYRGAGEQPFKKGKACTKCDRGQFYCTGDMCDCKFPSDTFILHITRAT